MTTITGMHRRSFLRVLGGGAIGIATGVRIAPSERRSDARSSRECDDTELGDDLATHKPTSSGLQRVVWSADTDEPVAALTFDDGPDPYFTPRILEVLSWYNVPATFMVMGYNAVRHPFLLREVVDAGHEIGGHGWAHLNLAKATPTEARTEIEYGTRMIEDRAGVPIRVFRPPYGRFGESTVRLLARARRDLVVWSVTRGELAWTDPQAVADHVVGALGPGDIVDLHDGIGRGTFNASSDYAARLRARRETELDALPRTLEGVRERGVRLERVSDLIAASNGKAQGEMAAR